MRAPGDVLVHLRRARDHADAHHTERLDRALDEGGMHGLGMNVDDCQATYDDLLAKGVEFVQPPEERPYGVESVARDSSGNWMVLVESRTFAAADFA